MNDHRVLLVAASLLLTLATTRAAHAQAMSGQENISSATANPERFLYADGTGPNATATDVTKTPRPPNLDPEGVNFTDCEDDLRLDFTLLLSGFGAADEASVQVWAGTVDCTSDLNRSSANGSAHACWQVAGSYGPVFATSTLTTTISVFARDVLRYEPTPAAGSSAQPFDPSFHSSSQGESACHVQPTDAAVPITFYFLAVNSSNDAIGTAFEYPLVTDLVGPPPPCSPSVHGGGDRVDVTWTSPGNDPDIAGFGVWTSTTGETSCALLGAGSSFLVGSPPSASCPGAGISQLPSGEIGGTIYQATATELTVTGLAADARYAAVVASIDGSGNVGPTSDVACAETTAAAPGSDAPTKVVAGCGCSTVGVPARSGSAIAVSFAALLFATRRRRRS